MMISWHVVIFLALHDMVNHNEAKCKMRFIYLRQQRFVHIADQKNIIAGSTDHVS